MYQRLCAFLLCLMLFFSACAYAENSFEVSYTVTFKQTEARSMIDMINAFRTGSEAWYWNEDDETKTWLTDLEPLAYDYDLEQVAMQRAAECAIHFSHTRPNNERCFTAYSMVNAYIGTKGENIAAGYGSASSVFNAWREDYDPYSGQGHRRNMLHPNFNCIGIGHVVYQGTHYWAQALGYRSDPNTTPTQANDGETVVLVTVSDALVTSSTINGLSQETLSIEYGTDAALPAMSMSLKMESKWPSYGQSKVTVIPEWTSADPNCVALNDDIAHGRAVGSTTLSAAVADEVFHLPVTVTYSNLLSPDYVFPGHLETIDAEAFFGTPVSAVEIPQGTTSIGSYAFANCSQLVQVFIPASVHSIADTAFANCSDDLTICCVEGSAAESFANAHGYQIVLFQ